MKTETKQFKKIGKSSELMWVLGTVLVALGVCMCKKADLGVSMIAAPTFIVYEAVAGLWKSCTVGTMEYLVQGAMLIILCAVVQRLNWRYLLAFLAAVIYGYVLDLWLLIFGAQPFEQLWLRWVMLFVGDTITAAGVACFFRTYLPLQVYELFVAEVADRYKIKVTRAKQAFDFVCLILSFVLAVSIFGDVRTFDWGSIGRTSFHSIGLGTIITTIINAPIIGGIGKLLDKVFDNTPLFPRVEKIIARNRRAEPPAEVAASTDENTADKEE